MRSASSTVVLLLFASLSVGVAVSGVGCGGKKDKAAQKAPPDIDGLAALGDGVRVVVGGDVVKLDASRLIRRGVAAMLARDSDLKGRVEAIVSECKLVPGDNITSFIIGLGEGPTDIVLVVNGTFEANALTACVQKRLTDSGGHLVTKAFGERTTYRADGGGDADPVWFALGSKRTLILAGSEAWLHKGLGQGPRMTDDARSKALLADAPTDHTLWAVGFVPTLASDMLVKSTGGAIEPPLTMRAHIEFQAGIQAELSTEMAAEKDAKALKGLHSLQKPALVAVARGKGLGELVNKVEVEAEGKLLKIRLMASEAELSDLLAAVDAPVDPAIDPAIDPASDAPGDTPVDKPASSQQNPPSPEPDAPGPQGDKRK